MAAPLPADRHPIAGAQPILHSLFDQVLALISAFVSLDSNANPAKS